MEVKLRFVRRISTDKRASVYRTDRSRMSAIQETIENVLGNTWGGSGVRRLFPTHNPTHKKYVLYELPRTLAVPAVLYVVVKPMSGIDTVEVWGSSPHGPTIFFNNIETLPTFCVAPDCSNKSISRLPLTKLDPEDANPWPNPLA